jgi:hypothetical protein
MDVARDNLHHGLTTAPGSVNVMAAGIVSNLIGRGESLIHSYSYYYAEINTLCQEVILNKAIQ